MEPGPQREIFPGGTKVDTESRNLIGPPSLIGAHAVKSFFVPAPNLRKIFFQLFAQNKVKSKKKVFTQI